MTDLPTLGGVTPMEHPAGDLTRCADDDDAVVALRDALSLVEAWDGDLTALFALETEATEDDHAVERSAKRTPYRRRDARKREAIALQNKIATLQHVIDNERAKRTSRFDGSSGLHKEWAAIATRQQQQRTEALVENEKLRLAATAQLNGAHKVARLMERVMEIDSMLPETRNALSFDQFKGPHVTVEDQVECLADALRQAPGIFQRKRFQDHDRGSFRDVFFRSCDPKCIEGIELEYQMGWVLPFSVREVADALWLEATRPVLTKSSIQLLFLRDELDVAVCQFIDSPVEEDSETSIHGQIAAQRSSLHIVDPTDSLVVNNIRSRVITPGLKGVFLNVYQWMRVERVDMPDNVEDPLSRVQWCHRVRVHPPDYASMTESERAKWIHRIVTGPVHQRVQKDLDRNIQHIENLLLTPRPADDTCTTKASPSIDMASSHHSTP